MKDVPIPLVLDLWSLGHSAGDIAERLGLPNHRHVSRIVQLARAIGDKRAVLHHAKDGRLIGRPGRTGKRVRKNAKSIGGVEATLLIGRTMCRRGHTRTPDNIGSDWHCLACQRLAYAAKRKNRQ